MGEHAVFCSVDQRPGSQNELANLDRGVFLRGRLMINTSKEAPVKAPRGMVEKGGSSKTTVLTSNGGFRSFL